MQADTQTDYMKSYCFMYYTSRLYPPCWVGKMAIVTKLTLLS